jgi:Amt family ammonium transporter
VSPEEELEGLDVGEHGNLAYPDFAVHSSFSVGGLPAGAPAAAVAEYARGYETNPVTSP